MAAEVVGGRQRPRLERVGIRDGQHQRGLFLDSEGGSGGEYGRVPHHVPHQLIRQVVSTMSPDMTQLVGVLAVSRRASGTYYGSALGEIRVVLRSGMEEPPSPVEIGDLGVVCVDLGASGVGVVVDDGGAEGVGGEGAFEEVGQGVLERAR